MTVRLFFVLVDGLDPSLGRLDYASLSHQALMEMIVDGITNKKLIYQNASDPEDIAEWEGVMIDDDKVVQIQWEGSFLEGSLNLEWLPSTVTEFTVLGNGLTGTLDLTRLCPAMKKAFFDYNNFTGSIDLERLPEKMETLSLSNNAFSGPLELGKLPRSLESLYADVNKFSGTINLTRLPSSLMYLCFHENSFSGTIDLSCLPADLQDLDLSHNNFSGEVFIPERLSYRVNVESTKLVKREMGKTKVFSNSNKIN